MERDTLLAIALRSSSEDASNVSGNHALAPAAIDKPKSNQLITSKCERFATTAPRNREHKIGSPTSQMNKMTSKSSSCNRCWEQKDRIFKALEPDGLGESYSL